MGALWAAVAFAFVVLIGLIVGAGGWRMLRHH
jgi:hypothetical protein